MKNEQATGLWAMIVLTAVMALLIGYYWVHKPLGLGLAQVWGGAALDLLTAGLIMTVAGGIGRRLLTGRLTMQQLSRAERIALEAGIGLGLLALVVLVIGMVGLLRPVALWVLMLAGTALNLWGMRGWLADMLHLARTLRPVTPWQRFLTLFCGVMLVTALLHALAPPVAWDALMYHLTGPQRYLAAEIIQPQPDNHYLGFPQGVEMLFTLAMGLFGRETAAAPLHFGYGLLALLAIGGLVRRYADASAGLFGVTLLLSSYSVWLLFGWPYVDLAVMAYALLVLVVVNQWRESEHSGWLVVAGVCLGLLVGVKYTGGLMAVAAAACVAFYAPRRAVRHVGLMAGVALLLFAPWLIRGLLLYENPVYPFLFDGLNWDTTRTVNFSQAYSGLLNSDSAWQLAVLPIAATIFGLEKAPGYSFTLGPGC